MAAYLNRFLLRLLCHFNQKRQAMASPGAQGTIQLLRGVNVNSTMNFLVHVSAARAP